MKKTKDNTIDFLDYDFEQNTLMVKDIMTVIMGKDSVYRKNYFFDDEIVAAAFMLNSIGGMLIMGEYTKKEVMAVASQLADAIIQQEKDMGRIIG